MKKILVLLILVSAIVSFGPPSLTAADKLLAPNSRLTDLAGARVELKSYITKQPTLLFFWTTWCPYCLKEIKVLNIDRKPLEEKGIAVLAINVGESRKTVERLVKNYNLGLKILLDEAIMTADTYGVFGVPTFILIDQEGRIQFNDNYYPKKELEGISVIK